VNLSNAADYFRAGARAIGVGTELRSTETARAFAAIVRQHKQPHASL